MDNQCKKVPTEYGYQPSTQNTETSGYQPGNQPNENKEIRGYQPTQGNLGSPPHTDTGVMPPNGENT